MEEPHIWLVRGCPRKERFHRLERVLDVPAPPITINALVKYIVGESENFLDNLFQCLSTRFTEDSSPKLERSEIRCQFVF